VSHREVFRYSPRSRYSIEPGRNIYLDTSVIRRKLSALSSSPTAPFSYTSALTHIELLAGVRAGSARQFYARRHAILAIRDAGIQVDWRMPDAVILAAFPDTRAEADIYETRCQSLQALVRALIESEDREQFLQMAKRLTIRERLEYFEGYKSEFGASFLAAGVAERHRSVSVFEPNEFTAQVLGLPSEYSHDELVQALQGSPFNYIMSLSVYAERVMERKGVPFSKEARKRIALSADRSIDPYLKGLGWWQMDHALGRVPGKNDALDLAHLLYLVPNAHLATADIGLAKCASAVGVSVVNPAAWAGV
jgi:hypothetical protein